MGRKIMSMLPNAGFYWIAVELILYMCCSLCGAQNWCYRCRVDVELGSFLYLTMATRCFLSL